MSHELKLKDDERSAAAAALQRLPGRGTGQDMRRKRPPVLSFLLRAETLRTAGRVVSLLVLDFAGLSLAIFTALALKGVVRGVPEWGVAYDQTRHWVSFTFVVTALLFARSKLYSERAARPGLARIVSSLFAVMAVSLVYALANNVDFSSYYIFYSSLFFSVVFIALLRYAYERLSGFILQIAGYSCSTLLIGTAKTLNRVAEVVEGEVYPPHNVVGYVAKESIPETRVKYLGPISVVADVLEQMRIQEVIIADSGFPQQEVLRLADICHQRGTKLRVAPSTMELLVKSAEFVPGQALPLFEVKSPVFAGFDYVLKRTFDLLVSFSMLITLSPLLLVIALAIKLDSRGAVIYRSWRPGIGGIAFACLKFRTMEAGAEARQQELEHINEADGALFKIRSDPRLTRVGKVLRKFSIDELPQLFNVVKGEMSLVGPRPLPQRDFERLGEWHRKRYLVLPGITGLWQVSGRSELDFDELVRLDFVYLERWSIFLDLVILLKTIPAVLSRRGAY